MAWKKICRSRKTTKTRGFFARHRRAGRAKGIMCFGFFLPYGTHIERQAACHA